MCFGERVDIEFVSEVNNWLEPKPVCVTVWLEPQPGLDPDLPVGCVVDVRIPRHTDKPPAPIDVRACRPAFNDEAFVPASLFADRIERESPVVWQIAPKKHMRVGLSGVEAIVLNGVYQYRVTSIVAVSRSELDIVV